MAENLIRPEVLKLASQFQNTPEPLLYKQWLRVYSDMTTHTQGRVGHKLKQKRPGEPSDIYQYRLSIARPITKGSIQKAISNCSRIFQNQSWSFSGSNILADFVTDNIFDGLNFRAWIERYIIPNMIEDPNGIIVWLPDNEGKSIVPKLYNSRKIRYWNEDALIVVDKDIKESSIELLNLRKDSCIEDGNYLKKETKFIAITKFGIYRFIVGQEGKKVSVIPLIVADFEYLPYTCLGGVMSSGGYYESFFQSFCPFADEAICEYSDHQAVNVTFSYPIREELGEKCSNKQCKSGNVIIDGHPTKCETCNGVGRIPVRSPYGVFFKKVRTDVGDQTPDQSSVDFKSPDVGILDYSSSEWEKKLNKAEDSIQLVRIWDNQSGIAKMIDREGLYSMMTDIKNNVFDNIIYKNLLIIETIINDMAIDPVVYKPVDLVIKTTSDLADEIKNISGPEIPKFVTQSIVGEQLLKMYVDNDYRKKIIEVMMRIDPLFSYNQADKERAGATGLLPRPLITRSLLLGSLLNQLAQEQSNFADMSDEAIVKWVDAKIKFYVPDNIDDASQFDAAGNRINTPT